ncbi:hypothetical protein [Vibrio mexicanus]|uniref:hypothetical protein n=1 Tax=Vibrio mexicanus TaxID=1004326 RepID=UPI00063CC4DA|nr:hypothetical protein [Vibrio mexicanus]
MVKNSGFATLLITSILLLCTLILVLGSYQTVFHQIKIAQNEVEGRKNYWLAEAGLECTFSYLAATNKAVSDIIDPSTRPADFSSWCSSYSSLPEIKLQNGIVANSYYLEALANNYDVEKTIFELPESGFGAIQSTGPIELIGTVVIEPTAKPMPLEGNEYECISVSFAKQFTYKYDATHGSSGRANGLEVFDPSPNAPFNGFDGQCHSDYKSVMPKNSVTYTLNANDHYRQELPAPFQKDFLPDPYMNPFPKYFGMPKTDSNIYDISRDSSKFDYVSLISSSATNCGAEITDHFVSGQTKGLWIEGNCHIDASVAAHANVSQMLVIQDGVLAVDGAMVYNGVIYHLVDYGKTNVKNRIDNFWSGLAFPNDFASFVSSETVGIQFASGLPTGGLVFDSPLGTTTIVGDIDLKFNAAANPISPELTYQWQRGSWNDL